MKTLYETLGGTYREENGRLIPEIKLPEQTNYQIGKYGQFYLDYIQNHRRGRYTTLLTEGKLNAQLHEIDLEASKMLEAIIPRLAMCSEAHDHYQYVTMYNGTQIKVRMTVTELFTMLSKYGGFVRSGSTYMIHSVIATTNKYEGMYDFIAEDGIFSAKISLNLK